MAALQLTEDQAVKFRTDEAQLLGLWTAARLLGVIREIEDREDRTELLTEAQILLTAFMVGLEPLDLDQIDSAPPRPGLGRAARFDA